MTPRFGRRSGVIGTSLAALVAATLATQGAPEAQAPVDPELLSLVAAARKDINNFWAGRIQGYRPPVDVLMVQSPTNTDCGRFEKPNARYCQSTHKIYWDVALFTTQFRLGDFAPVFILAHEWAHLAQYQMPSARPPDSLMNVLVELQADCLAGTYAADARRRKVLEAGDDDEAVLALRRAGDGLDDPWFDTSAHGSSGQRIDAFTYGLDGRDCAGDPFWEFLKVRGIDPSRVPQTPAPTRGRLDGLLPRKAGRFTITQVKRTQVTGATDALDAVYKSADGIEVATWLRSFANAEAASGVMDEMIKIAKEQGLSEVSRANVVSDKDPKKILGAIVVLRGKTEVVVWSNGSIIALVEGPFGVAQEFSRAVSF